MVTPSHFLLESDVLLHKINKLGILQHILSSIFSLGIQMTISLIRKSFWRLKGRILIRLQMLVLNQQRTFVSIRQYGVISRAATTLGLVLNRRRKRVDMLHNLKVIILSLKSQNIIVYAV